MVLVLPTLVLWLFQSSPSAKSEPNMVQSVAPNTVQPVSSVGKAAAPSAPPPDGYALGPGDQITVKALDFDEIDSKPITIDSRGYIDLPEIGRVPAAGSTPEQLEATLEDRLKKYLVHPEVSVTVGEIHSQRVSILGEVGSPGVHTLQGNPTLFEVLSSAGGLRSDAGYTVLITRQREQGPIPLPDAHPDASGEFSVASVSVNSIMTASNPKENIPIKPNDTITVPKGQVVYVIGAVKKAGGFLLNEHQSLSALQIMSLAEGLDKTAASNRAKVMRPIPGTNDHEEIVVDLKKMMEGKIADMPLKADDILFVPVSASKATGYKSLDILAMGASAFIYRIP